MTHEVSAVVETPGKISLQEFPLPEIGDEDGLLHVDMVGVCSSDYKYFHGKVAHRWSYPIIMG
ncbi:MAG: alcohol dehydrogenase, partial [Nitrospinae bacterium]|nr:alcohol dehydrogenase [Nitrospinota bacterium]